MVVTFNWENLESIVKGISIALATKVVEKPSDICYTFFLPTSLYIVSRLHMLIPFYPPSPQLSSVAPPPVQRNVQQNGPSLSALVNDSSPKSTVNSTVQAPRRKVVDEGKLRKV